MIIDKTQERLKAYRNSLAEHGESPKALQWKGYKSAAMRYRQLIVDLDINGKSILDVGCGMGDLLPYLYSKSDNFKYLGTDVVPEFIEIAKKRYLGHNFKVANLFADEISDSFDIVICSGVMNNNDPNWLEVRKKMIEKLFEHTKKVLVFNMAGGVNESYTSGRITYANSLAIVDYCAKLSPKLILRNHYYSKDFTIILFR